MNHKRKKIYSSICWTITIIQLILAIAAFILYRLSNTRMGVMRHVVYQSQKWEAAVNVHAVTYILCFILLFMIIIGVFYGIDGIKQKKGMSRISGWILTALSASGLLFNLLYTRQMIRIYYYCQAVWVILVLIQLLKCLLIKSHRMNQILVDRSSL